MFFMNKYSPFKLLLVSLASAVIIIYPNIACLPWELSFLDGARRVFHLQFFFFRYVFFAMLIWGLLFYNLKGIKDYSLKKRITGTLLLTVIAYLLFVVILYITHGKIQGFGSILLFQFFVVFMACTTAGHIYVMYNLQSKKEQEIERLKIENLQSRYDALTNQINPHFFFNSLNGLTALIRKKNDENTLEYVNKLSDVFRYILQSDKRGLVPLDEELEFVRAFRYMMEVRFANKLVFNIDVDKNKMDLKIPVLSMLPLIDNIVVHNTIDSEHKMEVLIRLNESSELTVSNPVYPKMNPSITNGTGIKNLENRFSLLMGKQIRIEDNGESFTVYLPLK
ncbi:MAG: histidine kinase [Tannerella sp.]|jgi:LytS/YehU family sensor histidine kinase|nr:histidine kinase [Tannerella sp.]